MKKTLFLSLLLAIGSHFSLPIIAQCGDLEIIATVNDPRCENIEDGFISLFLDGGNPPFNILWNDANASTSESIFSLP
ncbi:MAG: hypothetical protein AAFP19_16940, partial [Bacteroidota bacterium]